MDRRYYRKYENYDTVVPRPEDFPMLNSDNKVSELNNNNVKLNSESLKNEDLLLLVVLALLLMEEEKDMTAILSIAMLFFVEYIF